MVEFIRKDCKVEVSLEENERFKGSYYYKALEEDGKYLVYFDSRPDVIQFEKKNLRVHLDWTGFKWVRPKNKELVNSVFSCGTMVELRVDFAWQPAIIIKELENDTGFIVKYDYYKSHYYKSFRCIVGSRSVRPPQPSFSVGEYDLLDHVEAFTGFRWRESVVRGIVFEGRYTVSFGESL
ncbi:PREDICTED: DUF724 domain-containing protein 2-like [Camelina sativa]|uniref:DUF724 domain-containing protein 2-like n=1 Tax=Camelina sativa TaxID=90675 RepID=A0ABM1RIV5_CAMSA|nr:PREDICTED: DUF724 domain-containing protein 2-like [Camelina sativa]